MKRRVYFSHYAQAALFVANHPDQTDQKTAIEEAVACNLKGRHWQIVSDEERFASPEVRIRRLLTRMRASTPYSTFWCLERTQLLHELTISKTEMRLFLDGTLDLTNIELRSDPSLCIDLWISLRADQRLPFSTHTELTTTWKALIVAKCGPDMCGLLPGDLDTRKLK